MTDSPRCILLPCAGEGSRLGLPYPKELHFVLPGKALIDLTIERLWQMRRSFFVLIILRPGKSIILSYLQNRWPELVFRFAYQQEPGFIGAIKAGLPHLAANNLLLLPDQSLDEWGALERVFEHLENGAPTAVLAQMRADRSTLFDEGALNIQEGKVVAMAEKPGPIRANDFNAAWCGLGFKAEVAEALVSSLENLYKSSPPEEAGWPASPLKNAPISLVDGFSDLGQWDRLVAFQLRELP